MNMSQELKSQWLPKAQARYGRRNREGKSRMLDGNGSVPHIEHRVCDWVRSRVAALKRYLRFHSRVRTAEAAFAEMPPE